MTSRGFFSLLRWRDSVARDEAKNVAVLLVEPEGRYGGIRVAPISQISPRLRDQGILDQILHGLEEQFSGENPPSLDWLQNLRESLQHSVYLTEPRSTAIGDVNETLETLFRSYVHRPSRGSSAPTKGKVLDRVVRAIRSQGFKAERGVYIDDFIFDAVVHVNGSKKPLEVLSFGRPKKNWVREEQDAGHFLYSLDRLSMRGNAVIHPPTSQSGDDAYATYKRVTRWLEQESVRFVAPDKVPELFEEAH